MAPGRRRRRARRVARRRARRRAGSRGRASRAWISCAASPAGSSSAAPSGRSTARRAHVARGAIDLGRFESIRAVSTWFEPDEALALTAFRARKAKAHDGDVLTAAVLGPDRSAPVEDPRLSTTYGAERMADPRRPRAVADRRRGRQSSSTRGARPARRPAPGRRPPPAASTLRAEPFRWHSRGRDGAGIYILARRR